MRLTPVPCDRPASTTPSCAAVLRSAAPHAVDSSPVCASAPVDADATTVAADRDSPRLAPRSAESALPSSASTTAAHPADPSSACVLVWCGSRRRPDPQFKLQLLQQPLEPARVPAGFHPYPRLPTLLLQVAIELLRFFAVQQAQLAQLARVGFYQCNLLEARMIITPYNQHVRLLSSEPFGWFAPPKSTRAWEPTLFMESLHSSSFTRE